MHDGAPASAAEEWRRYFMLPVAAALGYTTSVIHIYGFGPYIGPVSESFGWSRAETTFGLTIATIVQAVVAVPLGMLVDRYGSRPFGLAGIVLLTAAFALLGTATGDLLNWYLLWGLIAVAAMPVQATVWTSAVATRFSLSRGMAFAVTLCGGSIATALFPVMGSYLIREYGWQDAAALHAGIWLAVAFPVILLFFRGARDGGARKRVREPAASGELKGLSLGEGLRSTIYHRLMIASLLYTFTVVGMVVQFVPILTHRGADPLAAASVASLIGIFAIIGRLGTGYLIDRLSASRVGAVVFLLPAVACLLLLLGNDGYLPLALAAMLIGLTLGAEVDVIAYLITQHFGLRSFGGLYGGALGALSVGTATGPLAIAAVFDANGTYLPFLWTAAGLMTAGSMLLFSLPRPRTKWT